MGTSKTVLILSTFAAFTVAYWYNVCNKQRKEAFYIAKQIDKTTINDTLFKLSLETDRAFPEPPKSPYHVIVKDDRTQIYRLYTPLLIDGRRVELIVRVYRNGIVSNILNSLERGDAIHISSPKPTQIYEPNTVSTLVMIAGGTGALPFYQLSKRILEDPVDKTSLFLIWVCGMENDFFFEGGA